MYNFENKVAVVTGAGSGMGKDVAIVLARNGAKVVVVGRSESNCLETLNAIKGFGGEAIFVKADVSKPDDVKKYVEEAVSTYGKIDLFFNNAGVMGSALPITDQDDEEVDQIIDINLKGVFLGLKYVTKVMVANGGGVIVNTSSVGGLKALPGLSPYVASKHAVVGLTKTAALELADNNIRVNVICPGGVMTPMAANSRANGHSVRNTKHSAVFGTPMGKHATVDDITNLVQYLFSDASRMVTGAVITLDGGMSLI